MHFPAEVDQLQAPLDLLGLLPASLEFLVDELVLHHLAQSLEDLVDRLAALGATLQVGDIVLLGELGSLFVGDLALGNEVGFSADEHYLRGLLYGLRQFVDPMAYMGCQVRTDSKESRQSMLKEMMAPLLFR